MDYEQIRDIIANARKRTPVRAYVRHDLPLTIAAEADLMTFPAGEGTTILVGDWAEVDAVLAASRDALRYHHVESDRRNSAVPLLDAREINARIEPGAFIRDGAEIGDNVIVMMGAVINIGAVVGAGTMIDMNAVVGARALVGANCHVGAGAVLAGVLEPPSATPVVVEDEVLIGANAVVLEGVRIGAGSVLAAGAVATKDIPAGVLAVGQPARVLKEIDDKTRAKTELLQELRRLND